LLQGLGCMRCDLPWLRCFAATRRGTLPPLALTRRATRRRGALRCLPLPRWALGAAHSPLASPFVRRPAGCHQSCDQLVLELGGLVVGQLARGSGFVDLFQLGPDARRVVVLLLGLFEDD